MTFPLGEDADHTRKEEMQRHNEERGVFFGADSESENPTVRDRLETTVLDVQYATR